MYTYHNERFFYFRTERLNECSGDTTMRKGNFAIWTHDHCFRSHNVGVIFPFARSNSSILLKAIKGIYIYTEHRLNEEHMKLIHFDGIYISMIIELRCICSFMYIRIREWSYMKATHCFSLLLIIKVFMHWIHCINTSHYIAYIILWVILTFYKNRKSQ